MSITTLTFEIRACSKGTRSRGGARPFNICRNETDAIRACSIGCSAICLYDIVCDENNSDMSFTRIAGILTSRVVEGFEYVPSGPDQRLLDGQRQA